MPKISVIIPVYKVEDFLEDCLACMSRQTYLDFELILVDDGSPDNCGAMCDAYAAEHPNTRVLHQTNMGLSEARNQGVKIATGEYVSFIDSDDLVSDDYLEYLLYLAEKYGADVSVANSLRFWDNEIIKPIENMPSDRCIPAEQALEEICYNKIDICAWGKLYKRYLVEKFPYPAGQLYEDTATTHKIVGEVPSIAHGTHVIYYWRQRSGSITHAMITERHMYGITASKAQTEYMKRNYPKVVAAAQARCVMKIVDLSYRLVRGKMDKDLFQRVRAEVIPLWISLLKNRKAGLSLKIRATALRLGYLPYLLVTKIYVKVKKNAKDV